MARIFYEVPYVFYHISTRLKIHAHIHEKYTHISTRECIAARRESDGAPNLFVKFFQFHVFIGKPFRFARIGSLVHLLCRHTRPYFMCSDLGIS